MTKGYDRWQIIRRNRTVCWVCRRSKMCEPVGGVDGEEWLCDPCRRRRLGSGSSGDDLTLF